MERFKVHVECELSVFAFNMQYATTSVELVPLFVGVFLSAHPKIVWLDKSRIFFCFLKQQELKATPPPKGLRLRRMMETKRENL